MGLLYFQINVDDKWCLCLVEKKRQRKSQYSVDLCKQCGNAALFQLSSLRGCMLGYGCESCVSSDRNALSSSALSLFVPLQRPGRLPSAGFRGGSLCCGRCSSLRGGRRAMAGSAERCWVRALGDTGLLWYLATSYRYWIAALNCNRLHTGLCVHGVYMEPALITPLSHIVIFENWSCVKSWFKKKTHEDALMHHMKISWKHMKSWICLGIVFLMFQTPFMLESFLAFGLNNPSFQFK